jgi:hypothetical protein
MRMVADAVIYSNAHQMRTALPNFLAACRRAPCMAAAAGVTAAQMHIYSK